MIDTVVRVILFLDPRFPKGTSTKNIQNALKRTFEIPQKNIILLSTG